MKLQSKIKEQAAQLLAEDRLSDVKIAETCGITDRTLQNWKHDEGFKSRIAELVEIYAERATKHGIARRVKRLAVLNDLHDKLLAVIEDRAQDEALADVPGGKTGLITKNLKGIGKGDDFQVVEVYEVDTATLREIRAAQEQAAKELGQWTEKKVMGIKRIEDMTDDELRTFLGDDEGEATGTGAARDSA